MAAITGTNGKTTTTTLLAAMINGGGLKAVACGNIGKAFAETVFELSSEDWAVLEVSSFQLETIETFRPNVAAVLNVTPDHLDRHGSMQAYVETKGRIFENQKPEDRALLNASDKYTPILSSLAKGQLYLFGFPGGKGATKPGCFVVGDKIELLGRTLLAASELKIPGPHNLENACAAAVMASLSRCFGRGDRQDALGIYRSGTPPGSGGRDQGGAFRERFEGNQRGFGFEGPGKF